MFEITLACVIKMLINANNNSEINIQYQRSRENSEAIRVREISAGDVQ